MGDSEAAVAHPTTETGDPSIGYNYGACPVSNFNTDSSDSANVTLISPPIDEGYALPNGASLNDGNSFSTDSNIPVAQATANSDSKFNQESSVSEAVHPVTDGSSNDNVNVENGSALGEQQLDNGSASSAIEQDRLWSIVKENCLDFDAWIALIQETEKVEEVDHDYIGKIRKVYDAFLVEFPLCYGYWKKYADHEARFGNIDKVVEVYERAVQAVTYSVDMWLHYCIFAISTYEDPDTVRRLFERGLAYVGTDYLSAALWDKYIEYEYSQQQWSNLAAIYTRILENPIQQLDRYYNSFKELATHRPLSEIQTAEEVAAMVASVNMEIPGTQGIENELSPVDQSISKPANPVLTEAEELDKYMARRDEMYAKAKEYESKIIVFETAIRRPYFHVKPLDDPQLDNWHNYLNFVERENDFNKIIKLYERCLIACANYPEYWIRYILCMEACGSMELAENALARATQVFVKRQPDIHLFAARFREQSGDTSSARAEYQLVHAELSPGLLEAVIKHANMEYRMGEKEAACLVYEDAIAIEGQKEGSQILPSLYVQYSRFLFLVAGNVDKAKEVLDGALEHVPLSKPLLEAFIYLESVRSFPKRIDYLDSLVEKFLTSQPDNSCVVTATDKEELSSIYLEFLDLFGDAQALKKAENRHAKLFLQQKSTLGSRKRSAEDFLLSDKTKLVKSYAGAPSTQSAMGAYPNLQNQWTSGSAPQTQAWQQVPQAHGQHLNSGYNQQVAYGVYAGYAGYTNPQMLATAPQTGTYGSYPAAYPSQQTYPPQSYPQSAPAFVPAQQQQTSGPQVSYYGSY